MVSKKQLTELEKAFEEKEDSINTWKPEKAGDMIFGRIRDFSVSSEFGTTALHLETLKEDENTLVYLKTALENTFIRKAYLRKDGNKIVWNNLADLENTLIGFRYLGKQKNEKTGRMFDNFKVLFQDELPNSIVAEFD